jgi:hypothetical protein
VRASFGVGILGGVRLTSIVLASTLAGLVGVAAAGCSSSSPGLSCGQSIDAFCAQGSGCLSFQDAVARCTVGETVSTAPCSGYDFVAASTPDATQVNYYDATTGKLVAVVFNGESCIAGPATFTVPSCNATAPCTPGDAGTPNEAGPD